MFKPFYNSRRVERLTLCISGAALLYGCKIAYKVQRRIYYVPLQFNFNKDKINVNILTAPCRDYIIRSPYNRITQFHVFIILLCNETHVPHGKAAREFRCSKRACFSSACGRQPKQMHNINPKKRKRFIAD
jgi:hypothetical protein